jgi:prolyl oligopeptidase
MRYDERRVRTSIYLPSEVSMFRKCQAVTLLLILSVASIAAQAPNASPTPASLKPPPAKTVDIVTDYFGTKVPDPYRWMESGTDDPQLLEVLKAQNAYTRSVLSSLKGRDAMLARIEQLDNAVPTVRSWQRGGSYLFYLETAPGAKTASLLVRDADGKSRTLLDPVSMEQGDSHAAIDYYTPSWDGRYVIAGVSLGGSENSTIHVIETATGRLLPDAITRTQYAGPSWQTDSRSFYYARLQKLAPDAPATAIYENERVYLHVIGSDPEKDPAVFGPAVSESVTIPKAGFVGTAITPGSNFAVSFYSAGTTDPPSLYIAPVANARGNDAPQARWAKIASPEDLISPGADSPVAIHGPTMYLLVDKGAPNRKLLSVDLDHPDIAHATEVVPTSDAVLVGVYAAQDGLYLESKRGVSFRLQRASYSPQLKWEDVALPYQGSISNVDANIMLPGVLFRLESWTQSDQAFAYDPSSRRVSNIALIQKHPADFSQVEAREVEATSADGTKVPLSILCKKGLPLDSSHPTLFEGYGAYAVSFDPYFDPRVLPWVERGGVFAIVHVRGGGEFGEAWHNAGRKETKQHTVDDMIAAAQYLIRERYTSPAHLAVRGTSAGGIAVGGAIVQHPELFAAAIDNVGMTDMLRFQISQGGAANVPEFGDVTDSQQFQYLYAVSPYHHIVAGTRYPAVLGITGTNDPRVPTWMVAKMITRLQAATASGKPILLRVDFDEGHGLGSSRPQRERLTADTYSFILWQSGDPEFQPADTAKH